MISSMWFIVCWLTDCFDLMILASLWIWQLQDLYGPFDPPQCLSNKSTTLSLYPKLNNPSTVWNQLALVPNLTVLIPQKINLTSYCLDPLYYKLNKLNCSLIPLNASLVQQAILKHNIRLLISLYFEMYHFLNRTVLKY